MSDLTWPERELLLAVYGERARRVLEVERIGRDRTVLRAGERTLGGTRRLRALADLYSRGVVAQAALNRFVLTASGRATLKLLLRGAPVTEPAGTRS